MEVTSGRFHPSPTAAAADLTVAGVVPWRDERVAWTAETAAARESGMEGREKSALLRRSETASWRDSCQT